jgi:hypothetical protein
LFNYPESQVKEKLHMLLSFLYYANLFDTLEELKAYVFNTLDVTAHKIMNENQYLGELFFMTTKFIDDLSAKKMQPHAAPIT